MAADPVLSTFHPAVARWFARTHGTPSPPQLLGWPEIAAGRSTLILAPTGSGKTLAAFLWAINHLVEQHLHEELSPGIRIVYVSPLKALNNDIHRNLESPLAGIREEAERDGLPCPRIRTAVRTGDTPQSARNAMLRTPPDILITTPESLYLMLTSKRARPLFRTVQYIIVDEIHALCGNKRGVHLSLTLERLQNLAEQECIRIGLSATQRPLEEIAAFLGGCADGGDTPPLRPVTIVNAGERKEMNLRVISAPADFGLITADGVWPLVFAEILDEIRRHRTTLIFVNNRRLAERMAAKLNEMDQGDDNEGSGAGRGFNLYGVPRGGELPSPVSDGEGHGPLVQAYHGSMSRTARERMERDLKGGRIRALVATSSLELGIDIGSIECVIQVQSPKGVARGLQRVGRSGHVVSAESVGRIYPTHREDLVESAVVAQGMVEHRVEPTTIPRDCLDVLAQQVIAMVSVEEWGADALYDLVRRSFCYRSLTRGLYDSVIRMCAGRSEEGALRDFRPRISWDRVNNLLRPLPGSSRLAILGGGTIADRGYFGVYLEDGKTKVGEVDEEFVFESRVGDTFILGTSVWRVAGIDANRVTVHPAPGAPARMPFWRGEAIGRSYELGRNVGAFRREMSLRVETPGCLAWLQSEFPLDRRAAWNIEEYFRRQRESSRAIPHDRCILVEKFRDELGDPRVAIHSSNGRRVNGLLALVLARRILEGTGINPEMLSNDDGILLRLPDQDRFPLDLFEGFTVAEAQEIILNDILESPLFAGQFRQNAQRALLMVRGFGGKRMPLWLQRLRAADLLSIARRSSDFPVVIETVREVLHDILDLPHFLEMANAIESGAIEVRTVETELPSPFTASLLFDFISVYMYAQDQPRADRQSSAMAINRELLGEILNLKEVHSLLRPEAIEEVEERLQHSSAEARARSPEELMEILLRLGDLSGAEIAARCEGDGAALLAPLAADGRAAQITVNGELRWIAGEELRLYTEIEQEANARSVIGRYLRSHGPVTNSELSARFGLGRDMAESLVRSLPEQEGMVRGNFRGTGSEEEWCYRPNLERIHRATLRVLRHEITPCSLPEFTRFLFRWTGLIKAPREGGESLLELLAQMQGLSLPAESWERDLLFPRLHRHPREELQKLGPAGEVLWAGTGPGHLTILFREDAGHFLAGPERGTRSEPARRIENALGHLGGAFMSDLRNATGLSLAALNAGLAELFWDGGVTNDLFSEVVALKRPVPLPSDLPIERGSITAPRHNAARGEILRRARKAFRETPGWSGRWTLLRRADPPPREEESREVQARQLLDRYGVLSREFVERESLMPWRAFLEVLQGMEMRGEVRRGYFVEGLSGMQFALPAAMEELRAIRSGGGNAEMVITLLNACDPANPYGPGVPLPHTLARQPGNFIAFHGGSPILLLENGGSSIQTIGHPESEAVTAVLRRFLELTRFTPAVKPIRRIIVEYWDGSRPAATPWGSVLRELGFHGDANQTLRYEEYR